MVPGYSFPESPLLPPPIRRRARWLSALALTLSAAPALAQTTLSAELVRRYDAPEADQGAAADDQSLYAVGNSEIGRYDKASGRKTGAWSGDPKLYPHLNSCAAIEAELVCAGSNYPGTPMLSMVEIFDRRALTHRRTIALGQRGGSLTWVTRHGGAWWACFANYDGKGGEPGRDHRATILVKFDDDWRRLGVWRFPADVLDRMAPHSASGGVWGDGDLLYVTGHDLGEVYVMRAPPAGGVLDHVATIIAPIEGQAIGLDPTDPSRLYGVSRKHRQIIAMQMPKLPAP